MKQAIKFKLIFLLILAAAVLLAANLFYNADSAFAIVYPSTADEDYSFHFVEYHIDYDVKSNRSIDVESRMLISYDGRNSTGFIHAIPLTDGVKIKKISVAEVKDSSEREVWHDVYVEEEYGKKYYFLDVGDESGKFGSVCEYIVRYEMNFTKADGNGLDLTPFDRERAEYCYIESASVSVKLPAGYLGGVCRIGSASSERDGEFTVSTSGEGTVITVPAIALNADEGLTFHFDFGEGALSTYFDATPCWFVLAGFVIILLLVALKLAVFNRHKIRAVDCDAPPRNLDPLMIGKLIDNKVNAEDITAMIYYFANAGYLKISFENPDDPALIKVYKSLPPSAPSYQTLMYNRLFAHADVVRSSELSGNFYTTAQQVTAMVDKKAKGMFTKSSTAVSLIVVLLGGLLLGLTPFILGITQISIKYTQLFPLVIVIPMLAVYGFAESVKYLKYKITAGRRALYYLGIALFWIACGLIYIFFVPNYILGYIHKTLLISEGGAIAVLCVALISPSQEYAKILCEVLGFKKYIEYEEKNEIGKLVEKNPQEYYKLVPYAQVLGISADGSFDSLTLPPPSWSTFNGDDLLTFVIINSAFRRCSLKMATDMFTPPPDADGGGINGGSHGGFNGGGGGGHTSFRGR